MISIISSWSNVDNLNYLALVIIAAIIFFVSRKLELRVFRSLGANFKNMIAHSYNKTLSIVRVLFLCLGLAFLVIALAGPRGDFVKLDTPTKGRNILIAVDISLSMLAQDIKPSRLEQAKREILDLLDLLDGDRVGLIVFAGSAFSHLPLTVDYAMVRLFVESLSSDLITNQGSDLSGAIKEALKSLQDQKDGAIKSRDLIVITDGEDHGPDVYNWAHKAKNQGIRIYTIAVGSDQGAPLAGKDGRYIKDNDGNIVISKLDENTLKEISAITGGLYVKSSVGDEDLNQIFYQGIEKSSQDEIDMLEDKIYNEYFYYALFLTLLMWVLAILVSPYLFKALFVCFFITVVFNIFSLIELETGINLNLFENKAYGFVYKKPNEDFYQALKILSNQQSSADDLNMAKSFLLKIITDSKSSRALKHAAYYNLFQIAIKQNDLKQALLNLKQAYDLDNDHQATIDNLKWLVSLLEFQQDQDKDKKQHNSSDQSKNQDHNQEQAQNQDQAQTKNNDAFNNEQNNEQKEAPKNSKQDENSQAQNSNNNSQQSQNQSQNNLSNQSNDDDKKNDMNTANKKPQDHTSSDNKDESQQAGAHEDDHQNKKDDSLEEKNLASQVDKNKVSDDDNTKQKSKDQNTAIADQNSDPDLMNSSEAIDLFQSLEDNLKAYGKKSYQDKSSDKKHSQKRW